MCKFGKSKKKTLLIDPRFEFRGSPTHRPAHRVTSLPTMNQRNSTICVNEWRRPILRPAHCDLSGKFNFSFYKNILKLINIVNQLKFFFFKKWHSFAIEVFLQRFLLEALQQNFFYIFLCSIKWFFFINFNLINLIGLVSI